MASQPAIGFICISQGNGTISKLSPAGGEGQSWVNVSTGHWAEWRWRPVEGAVREEGAVVEQWVEQGRFWKQSKWKRWPEWLSCPAEWSS